MDERELCLQQLMTSLSPIHDAHKSPRHRWVQDIESRVQDIEQSIQSIRNILEEFCVSHSIHFNFVKKKKTQNIIVVKY